jgi:tetratricopeptide (TPR) repeat protein
MKVGLIVALALALGLLAGTAALAQVPDKSAPLPSNVPPAPTHTESGSSSRSERGDISPPKNDAKDHPDSLIDEDDDTSTDSANSDVSEMHPWDPHRALKNVEVGDFYFKRKNYKGAAARYKEALTYKPDDAEATFKLAESLEKLNQPQEARRQYESYLKILPHGPHAEECKKALDRLGKTAPAATASTGSR